MRRFLPKAPPQFGDRGYPEVGRRAPTRGVGAAMAVAESDDRIAELRNEIHATVRIYKKRWIEFCSIGLLCWVVPILREILHAPAWLSLSVAAICLLVVIA